MLPGGLVIERDEQKQPEPVCPMPTPASVDPQTLKVDEQESASAPKKRGRPKKNPDVD